MKTIALVLLGFAGLLPATCSKSKSKDQSQVVDPRNSLDTMPHKADIALYGPAIIIVKKQQQVAKV